MALHPDNTSHNTSRLRRPQDQLGVPELPLGGIGGQPEIPGNQPPDVDIDQLMQILQQLLGGQQGGQLGGLGGGGLPGVGGLGL